MSYCATEPSVTLEMLKSAPDNRVHVVTVNSRRYVTILYIPRDGSVRCVDSACYHAGGPLGLGRVEEVDGDPCIMCPNHGHCVSLLTGSRLIPMIDIEDGCIIQKGMKRTYPYQRVHETSVQANGTIYVKMVDLAAERMSSDKFAQNHDIAHFCKTETSKRQLTVSPPIIIEEAKSECDVEFMKA
eukprot:PhF_6_TR31736/c0_g1_i1/m.46711